MLGLAGVAFCLGDLMNEAGTNRLCQGLCLGLARELRWLLDTPQLEEEWLWNVVWSTAECTAQAPAPMQTVACPVIIIKTSPKSKMRGRAMADGWGTRGVSSVGINSACQPCATDILTGQILQILQ